METSCQKHNIKPLRHLLNPLGYHLIWLFKNPDIRHIILYGGSSSGKSYSVAQILLLQTMSDASNTIVFRKYGTTIDNTIYQDFKRASLQLGVRKYFRFIDGRHQIVCVNGAKIDFKGLDDEEKIKGISDYKRIFCDEWNEFFESDDDQLNLRMRGLEGQQKITAFNPVKATHWIKTKRFDAEVWHDVPIDNVYTESGKKVKPELTRVKSMRANEPKMIVNPRTGKPEIHPSDTMVIQTTYLNNFWIVGSPDGTFGYYDRQVVANYEKLKQVRPDLYEVYALGEWGVVTTGTEFFSSFNRTEHVSETVYDPSLPIHISVDANVLPYITCTLWQVDYSDGIHLRQIDEILATAPNNSVRLSARLAAGHFKTMGVNRVILHGDASTRAANNIDDKKRSFHDLYIAFLNQEGIDVIDKVGHKNPDVAMSGEFINAIFDDLFDDELKITIGEQCKVSIEDYLSVQKDENGAILKKRVKNKDTGQSYEEGGHISDTFRYVVTDIMNDRFIIFANKRKRNLYAGDGFIRFYNPNTECKYSDDLLYCMPNLNGRLVFVNGKKCGESWHIVSVGFVETTSSEVIKTALNDCNSRRVILECSKSYFTMARELRDELSGDVRVLHESGDIQRRIAATSDYVKTNVLFNETALNEEPQYSEFMTNLLDYNKHSGENIEASAVLSGFVQVVLKLGL